MDRTFTGKLSIASGENTGKNIKNLPNDGEGLQEKKLPTRLSGAWWRKYMKKILKKLNKK
ncbi:MULTISPECIES: hypothetical protein [Methanosarcina]|uniref:hypothetical protein n=1 Tax=Methanosarcina TaxID=2207 RepID=UPI00064F944C|nr:MULTISPECIES: hypothetical protein [Methanosarcina]OEC92128.1 hypothetical protein A9239_17510 [Methanosarcina sp. A14]